MHKVPPSLDTCEIESHPLTDELTIVSPPLSPHPTLTTNILLRVTVPAPTAVWHNLAEGDPEALPSQSLEWLNCLKSYGGYENVSRLYEFSDGQQVLLPLAKRKGLPTFLSVQASMPHTWGMGGVLSKRELRVSDIEAIFDDLGKQPFLGVSICPNPRQGHIWQSACPPGVTVSERCAHVVNLEGGFDIVWHKRFSKTTRRMVQKAERSEVIVESDATGRLAPIFYDLFHRSVDRWAKQQNEPRWLAHLRAEQRDPLKKIQHIAKTLGDGCHIWVAWHQGLPTAAAVILFGKNADYALGAMDKDLAAPVYANYLLHKRIIEEACRRGCSLYHMGESGASAGISSFKERFGARAYPYSAYHLERFPLTKLERRVRGFVKRTIGFKDA